MKRLLFALITLTLISFAFAETTYPTTVAEMTAEITLNGSGKISDLKKDEEVKFQTLTFQDTPYQEVNSIQEIMLTNGKQIKPT